MSADAKQIEAVAERVVDAYEVRRGESLTTADRNLLRDTVAAQVAAIAGEAQTCPDCDSPHFACTSCGRRLDDY